MLPPAIHIPRAIRVDLDAENKEMYTRPMTLKKVRLGAELYVSPFFVLIDLSSLP